MVFHEIRFPTDISLASRGGPERRTEIVVLGSGHEERNTRWRDSRRRFNAGYGIKTLDELHAVIAFFEERRGRLYGFRWRDFMDYKSSAPSSPVGDTDQSIGTGNGETAAFQLTKQYGSDHAPYTRTIAKPVAGTVMVAVDRDPKQQAVDYTLNEKNGIITFSQDAIPVAGQPVTAGFEFDVPVRFDTDTLTISMAKFKAGDIPNIPIVEIRV